MSEKFPESRDNLNKYARPVEGTADKAIGIGRDLLGPVADLLMPGASSAITTFTDLVKTPYQRRLQQWQENIGTGVIELSEFRQNIVNELKANEEFQSVLLQATQAAIRSHQKEKLSALRNAVVNTAKGIDISSDLKQLFVRYVDELTPSHLTLLRFFNDNLPRLQETESYQDLFEAFKVDSDEHLIGRDEFKLLCKDLKARVLLRVSSNVNDFHDIYEAVILSDSDPNNPTTLPFNTGDRHGETVSELYQFALVWASKAKQLNRIELVFFCNRHRNF